jgi:hypothetical protein
VDSKLKLEAELADADAQIRSAQASIDQTHIGLCASAVRQRLEDQISRAKNSAMKLAEIEADWAQSAARRLRNAILDCEIKHGDREANIPKTTGAPWMKNRGLELNSGLVAIIGARESGKTALADTIAAGAHAEDAGKGEASFLFFIARQSQSIIVSL